MTNKRGLEGRIYSNPRAWRARIAQAAISLLAAGMVWLFVSEDHAAMTSGDRIAVWFGLIFGVACFLAFEVYLRRYVVEMKRDGDALAITTLATAHRRTVRIRDGSLGRERGDRSNLVGAPSVNNMWIPLRVPGMWPPFILDATPPAMLNRGALDAALRRASGSVKGPKGRGDGRRERR